MFYAFSLTLFSSFLLTYFFTPLVKRFAQKSGALDLPDERKIHEAPVPRWGGVAIYFGVLAGLGAAAAFSGLFRESLLTHGKEAVGIFGACTWMVLVGLKDDLRPIPAKLKFVLQILAGLWLLAWGVRVEFISNPVNHRLIYLNQYLAAAVTLFWITGITNALNLLDGLDGLLAGISTISSVALFFVALEKGYLFPAFILMAMCGATLAFLRYNFNPAEIFLGDAGSLFLGMLWASVSIAGALKTTTVAIFIPLLILGIPIADTLYAIIRRFGKRQSIFAPDKEHLHHRLLRLGWSQRKAVFIFYIMGGALGTLALVLNHLWK